MDNKYFVAIGKMIIDNLNTEWNIPDLHFIVNKTPTGLFEATNIEFILDSTGSTIEEAIEGLTGLTIHYITMAMEKGRGYVEFIDKVNSLTMEEYWREYRNIEFSLARNRKDLSHEIGNKINIAIKNMLAEEITQQIREVAAGVVKTIITNINIQIATLEAA
jgi:sulfite reductase alpha subunit-like flavoprotein